MLYQMECDAQRAGGTPVEYRPPVPCLAMQEGVFNLPDAELFYRDNKAAGPCVVFFHPATGSAMTWAFQEQAFTEAGYRVICYSRRGYYRSTPVDRDNAGSWTTDLLLLLEALGIDKFHGVGCAAGGLTLLDFAVSYPERLHSMVLASTICGVQDEVYLKLSTGLRPPGFDEMPPEFRELSPSFRAASPEGVEAWVAQVRIALSGNRLGQTNLNRITLSTLQSVQVRTLFMTGDADLWMPPSLARGIAKSFPNCEMVTLTEVGHCPYWECPDLFNELVLKHIGAERG